jgi:hypothetical protein
MAAEATAMEAKGPQPVIQKPARRRAAPAASESESGVRFFLADKEGNGANPSLGREVGNENEALIESLKAGMSFYALTEFRAVPDVTGKAPLIRKEVVRKAVITIKEAGSGDRVFCWLVPRH